MNLYDTIALNLNPCEVPNRKRLTVGYEGQCTSFLVPSGTLSKYHAFAYVVWKAFRRGDNGRTARILGYIGLDQAKLETLREYFGLV